MKNFILTAVMAIMLISIPVETQAKGPFENYLDCAEECMDKYAAWTLRLSACAADCYIGFLEDMAEAAKNIAVSVG